MASFLTEDTKVIILLCAVLGKNGSVKPLALGEYNALVRWLISENLRPSDLLDSKHHASAAIGSGIDQARLDALLGRGVQLGFAVENWQRSSIWVISRSDKDYPIRLKRHLKEKAPPLLFGTGDRALLQGGGLAIVGSRKINRAGEKFTQTVASLCASNLMPVVSGGARGVDQIAMSSALDAGGVVIGILAENLLKKSIERQARQALANKQLLLISPYHPEARFTVGTAMGRNKLIYAMADRALIVSAEHKKGGTWAGATEELKRDPARTVFVQLGDEVPSGNKALIDLGAVAWPDGIDEDHLGSSLEKATIVPQKEANVVQRELGLFSLPQSPETVSVAQVSEPSPEADDALSESQQNDSIVAGPTNAIYQAILPVILEQLHGPVSVDELAVILNVSKAQLNHWLKQAVAEQKVCKLTRPVRYCQPEVALESTG